MNLLVTFTLCGVVVPAVRCDAPPEQAVYVEFDFSTLPRDREEDYRLRLTVLTTNKVLKYSMEGKMRGKRSPEGCCDLLAASLMANSFKVEVVDKTKLRVYGRIFNDELIPAIQGRVESPDLKKEELPRVKNPNRL